MTNLENQIQNQTLHTGEPVAAAAPKPDLDLSSILAAEREANSKGSVVVIGEYLFTTLGQPPAWLFQELTALKENTDVGVFINMIAGMFIPDDVPKFLKFVKDENLSADALAEIYKQVMEQITGKTIPQPAS